LTAWTAAKKAAKSYARVKKIRDMFGSNFECPEFFYFTCFSLHIFRVINVHINAMLTGLQKPKISANKTEDWSVKIKSNLKNEGTVTLTRVTSKA